MDERSFGAVPAAHILQREDEFFFRVVLSGPPRLGIHIFAVRLDCIRRAREQDRIRLSLSFGTYTAVNRWTPSRIGMLYSYLV